MHYTGTIWRPPYEAASLLLEVTAGCTHHRCKFCTLYHDLPFPFRMSPLEDIEHDLREAQLRNTDPIAMLTARLQGLPKPEHIQRVSGFLVANMAFFFLPPCVGVIEHANAIFSQLAPFLLISFLTVPLVYFVTAWVVQLLIRHTGKGGGRRA